MQDHPFWEQEGYRVPTAEDMDAVLAYLPFLERNKSEQITDSKPEFSKTARRFLLEMRKHAFTAGGEQGRIKDADFQFIRKPELISGIDLPTIQRLMTYEWRKYHHQQSCEPFLHDLEERVVSLHILRRLAIMRTELRSN
jgi:hypothetical protein